MGRDDWYRSSDWDAKARAEFEARLAGARGDMRVQYRRIKALALLEGTDGIKVAAGREMLLSIVHDGDAPTFVASRFRLALAATKVALARGQAEVASDWARAALTYASAKHSGLANHPTLLLAKADKSTRAWLESVASGKPHDIRAR